MIAVSCSTCTTREDVRGQVVDLLAVLVTDDRAASGASVGSEGDAILKIVAGLRDLP